MYWPVISITAISKTRTNLHAIHHARKNMAIGLGYGRQLRFHMGKREYDGNICLGTAHERPPSCRSLAKSVVFYI